MIFEQVCSIHHLEEFSFSIMGDYFLFKEDNADV
jgi:hypothetical protein